MKSTNPISNRGKKTNISSRAKAAPPASKRKPVNTKKGGVIKKADTASGNVSLALHQPLLDNEEDLSKTEWIKSVIRTSYDVMWDWNLITGNIYVGDCVEEVFGYKLENNRITFADFYDCLVPAERKAIKDKIYQALASPRKNWNDAFMFRMANGSVASVIARGGILRDASGNALRMIGFLQDNNRQEYLEKKLEKQLQAIPAAEVPESSSVKASFDLIWDWNLMTHDVFIGDGVEKITGEPIDGQRVNIRELQKYLYKGDRAAFERSLREALRSKSLSWEHTFRIRKKDGVNSHVYLKASIIRYLSGQAHRIIGTVQDISSNTAQTLKADLQTHDNALLLKKYEENFKLIFNTSGDILFDIDLVAGEVILNDAYEREFGYKVGNNIISEKEFLGRIHSADKAKFRRNYNQLLNSGKSEWKFSFRYLKADRSVADVITRGMLLRNTTGQAYRRIGYMQNVSEQRLLEKKLAYEMSIKKQDLVFAAEDAKERERSDIGRELHDNVNQLLGASRMFQEMARKGGAQSKMLLNRSSEYTLKAIEEIRKLTKGLSNDTIQHLGLKEAVTDLTNDLMEVNPVEISCDLNKFREDKVLNKFKLALFRIIQEQLNNILKHAKASKVEILLVENKRTITLAISDNGVGFDPRKKRNGVGVANIISRASFYKGMAKFISQPGNGCLLNVNFPIKVVTED